MSKSIAIYTRFYTAINNISNPVYGYAQYKYEEAFIDKDITDILDLVTILYKVSYPHDLKIFYKLLEDLNSIILDESMCYEINEQGEVRYFPDEEFHKNVKLTLTVLAQSSHQNLVEPFNKTLDELYQQRNHESPLSELFKCVETSVLTMLNDVNQNRLNDNAIDKLFKKVLSVIDQQSSTSIHYTKKAHKNLKSLCNAWVTMCHNYRHGKDGQENRTVPNELFNFLFSTGVTIFRFILELEKQYIQTST